MDLLHLFPAFVVGLAGSVHCVGMCGGIVGAFSLTGTPAARPFPVAVVTRSSPLQDGPLLRVLAYNSGRLASYSLAGAFAGGLAGGVRTLAGLSSWQAGAWFAASLMMVLLGLHLAGAWSILAHVERLGQGLWARLRPLTGALMPLDSPAKLLALGALWGWLPCGMVYSMLLSAALAGSARDGALLMAAFGLGTLPMLMALGLAGARLRLLMQAGPVRVACGLVVAGFGVLGMVRAAGVGMPPWLASLCLAGGGA